MLHHVSAQEHIGKAIERRSDGEPNDGEAEKKRRQTPCGKQRRSRLANSKPAACVDDSGESQHRGEEDGWGPLLKDGPVLSRHGNSVNAELMIGWGRLLLAGGDQALRGIDGRRQIAVQRGQETDECCRLGRAEGVAVGGHVASTLQDLPNDLVFCHAGRDGIERRARAVLPLRRSNGSCGTACSAGRSLPHARAEFGRADKPQESDRSSRRS